MSVLKHLQQNEQQNAILAPSMHTGVPWAIKLAGIKGQEIRTVTSSNPGEGNNLPPLLYYASCP